MLLCALALAQLGMVIFQLQYSKLSIQTNGGDYLFDRTIQCTVANFFSDDGGERESIEGVHLSFFLHTHNRDTHSFILLQTQKGTNRKKQERKRKVSNHGHIFFVVRQTPKPLNFLSFLSSPSSSNNKINQLLPL